VNVVAYHPFLSTTSGKKEIGVNTGDKAAVSMGVAIASALAIPAAQAAPTDTATSTITWGSCSDPVLAQAHAQCGMLTVPLDYQNPAGSTIQLAVSRVQHTSSARGGVSSDRRERHTLRAVVGDIDLAIVAAIGDEPGRTRARAGWSAQK